VKEIIMSITINTAISIVREERVFTPVVAEGHGFARSVSLVDARDFLRAEGLMK